VLLPVYQYVLLPLVAPGAGAAKLGFSHAYYGATRHAITVGFVSLMIVGVAARLVPTLNGRDVRSLPGLWVPFLLLNAGCALRVVGQTLTDFTAWSFPFTGASGVLEVTGLAVWGVHLWSLMPGRAAAPALAESVPAAPALHPGEPIAAGHLVAAVLDVYPGLLPTFVSFGFHALQSPVTRRAVGRYVTVEAACRLVGVDRDEFLEALNARLGHEAETEPGEGACCPGCAHHIGHCR
jgi:hypothetical protein